jgi:hypothetical protein
MITNTFSYLWSANAVDEALAVVEAGYRSAARNGTTMPVEDIVS